LLDHLQVVCSVFVTFASEEGINRAKQYNTYPHRKFLEQIIDVKEASEPTDIIWENRHFTKTQLRLRNAVV
jgi:hypothetical protein